MHGPTGTINTYALYDDAASVSMIEAALADKLGLAGPAGQLDLQWYGDHYASEESRTVAFHVNGLFDGARRF